MGASPKLKQLRGPHIQRKNPNRFPPHGFPKFGPRGRSEVFSHLLRKGVIPLQIVRITRGPPFPVKEGAVIDWGSISRANFPNYVGYVRKSRYFPERPADWGAEVVGNNIAASLKLDAKGRFRPTDCIRSLLIAEIIHRETTGSPLARLAFLAFRYAPRVPSSAELFAATISKDFPK